MGSSDVRSFAVLIPAGTAIATPQVTALALPPVRVDHVRVRIPPGPMGSVGWALGLAGVPLIPVNVGGWIVADNEVLDWDLDDAPTSGAWQLIAYNTGNNPHTLYVTFLSTPVQRIGAAGLGLVSPLTVTA
jgi:hypothetical protein